MAEVPDNLDPNEGVEQNHPAVRASMLSRLNVLLILAALVAFECIVAYFIMPTPQAISDEAVAITTGEVDAQLQGETGELPVPALIDEGPAGPPEVDVDLGEFVISRYKSTTNTTMRIDFQMWATIKEEDQEDFNEVFEKKKSRIEAKVIEIFRNSDPADLEDASLSLIRRRISSTINKIIGKAVVRNIIFTRFNNTES